jgi:maleate isomerase
MKIFMESKKIDPKFNKYQNPKIGLIALASDYMIEKDFIKIIKNKKIDFFVNRIECFNPLTKENLIKMSEKVTEVTKDILPDEKIDCIAYGCTSGTIAAGYEAIEKKIKKAKPETTVTTPSTASIKALKKLNVNKVAIFTPYSKKLNNEVLDFFKKENFEITANSYFNIESDIDIGKVDSDYLYEVLSKMNLNGAEVLFISCTALPALSIIEKLEKKLNITVLSSNQTLIWDTLNSINNKETTKGFGKIFEIN